MKNKFKIYFFSILTIILLSAPQAYSGDGSATMDFPETDSSEDQLLAFFDLRDRETYIQVTNTGNDLQGDTETNVSVRVHIQIFNVDNNCSENNFFDNYTPADTHVYNMNDVQTNDGTPSGVVLPEGAYGVVVISTLNSEGDLDDGVDTLIGNIRILDIAGYEYRTNITAEPVGFEQNIGARDITINFNTVSGVSLSDVVGISFERIQEEGVVGMSNILEDNTGFTVDIYNNSEVAQSCRNIIFACTDQDNPLLEELLSGGMDMDSDDDVFSANVASFEYGINNAIPHSRGSELLCPGNITSEGLVKIRLETFMDENKEFVGYIGLNNGNGRGSFDSFWLQNGTFFNGQLDLG